jgi:hypothetical protein
MAIGIYTRRCLFDEEQLNFILTFCQNRSYDPNIEKWHGIFCAMVKFDEFSPLFLKMSGNKELRHKWL